MRLPLTILALSSLAFSGAAAAHNGLPETWNLTSREGSPDTLFAGATFGAVLSVDRGAHWSWVCPESIGSGARPPDAYLWKPRGLFAATDAALRFSRDGACTFQSHATFASLGATAVASHPSRPELLYVSTSAPGGEGSGVWRSDDGGETFAPTGLQRSDLGFLSVWVSAADPDRLWATAYTVETPRQAVVFSSTDGGAHWAEARPDFGLANAYKLSVFGSSPTDPSVVFARLHYDQSTTFRSKVFRSDDGGATFTEVLSLDDYAHGLEVSPDGTNVWVATYVHLYRSTDGGRTFAALAVPNGNACATWHDGALYGCGSVWVEDTGWSIARSDDLGDHWTPLFAYQGLQPPTQCPVGTPTRELCEPLYPGMAATLGISTPAPDAGVDPPPPVRGCGCGAGEGSALGALALMGLTFRRRR